MYLKIFGYQILIRKSIGLEGDIEKELTRKRLRKIRKERIAKHQCLICKKKINDINPKTGEYYRKCLKHRERENELKRKKYAR